MPVIRIPRAPNAEIVTRRPTLITELIFLTATVRVCETPFVPVTVSSTFFDFPVTLAEAACRHAGLPVPPEPGLLDGLAGVDDDDDPDFDDEPIRNFASRSTPFRVSPE